MLPLETPQDVRIPSVNILGNAYIYSSGKMSHSLMMVSNCDVFNGVFLSCYFALKQSIPTFEFDEYQPVTSCNPKAQLIALYY